MTRVATYLLVATGCAWAQAGDPLDVRGVVVEPGANRPVAGAQVTLYEVVRDQTHPVTQTLYATAPTNARGTFQFHVERFGAYFLEVKKEGYSGIPGPRRLADGTIASGVADLDLRQDQLSPELRFYLMRPGELTGRVINEDGKPVGGLHVSARTSVTMPEPLAHDALTDRDGFFSIPMLTPDRYLIRISPASRDSEIVMDHFTETDLKVVDQDVETSYWPGGPNAESASPIPVSPGASTNLGTITVHKASYYRVHVSVIADDCGSQEWQFSAVTAIPGWRLTPIPCAKEFLVSNLKPGSYWFTLSNQENGEKNRQGITPVEVTHENVSVMLTMSPGAMVHSRIIAAEGATLPPPSQIVILATPVISSLPPGVLHAQPDSEDRFLFQNLAATRYQISVAGLAGKYYVNEIRYNNRPAPEGLISASPDAQLEIVIDDKAAVISGSVTDGDKPASRPRVVLMDAGRGMIGKTMGDAEGKFQITGIAPGEYSVLAIPEPANGRFPDNLSRFLGGAEKVTLERGGVQNVSLKLIDTSR